MEANETINGGTRNELSEVIEKRNARLHALFLAMGYNVKILGSSNPAVIINDCTIVSCYVHNFELIFTSVPYGGDHVFTYKLTEAIQIDPETFHKVMSNCVHRPVLHLKTPTFIGELMICGWNFTERNIE